MVFESTYKFWSRNYNTFKIIITLCLPSSSSPPTLEKTLQWLHLPWQKIQTSHCGPHVWLFLLTAVPYPLLILSWDHRVGSLSRVLGGFCDKGCLWPLYFCPPQGPWLLQESPREEGWKVTFPRLCPKTFFICHNIIAVFWQFWIFQILALNLMPLVWQHASSQIPSCLENVSDY